MEIDLGTVKMTLPDSSPLVPVQLLCRGVRDSVEALKLGMTTKASTAQAFSRLMQVTIEEIEEGKSEREGLDAACGMVVAAYRGEQPAAKDYAVEKGVARTITFKWRGPNAVPLRTCALVHVNGIVARSVLLSSLDTPKVNVEVDAQFNNIIASMSPAPKIVP